MRALLVGVGNIGFRHFQSLVKFAPFQEIGLVELNPERRAALLDLCGKETALNRLRFYSSVAEAVAAGGNYDLAVSAVTANHQPQVVQQLSPVKIQHLVLEKPVAQSLAAVKKMVGSFPAVYVNTPRAFWSGYQQLKLELGEKCATGKAYLEIEGNRWGIGCNGLHFIHLARFLFGFRSAKVTEVELVPQAEGSKRGGQFEEFCGSFSLTDERGNRAHFRCSDGADRKVGIERIALEIAGARYSIDELGSGIQKDGQSFAPMGIQFVSESTYRFCETALDGKGNFWLPTLEDSVLDHTLLFSALERATGRQDFKIT